MNSTRFTLSISYSLPLNCFLTRDRLTIILLSPIYRGTPNCFAICKDYSSSVALSVLPAIMYWRPIVQGISRVSHQGSSSIADAIIRMKEQFEK